MSIVAFPRHAAASLLLGVALLLPNTARAQDGDARRAPTIPQVAQSAGLFTTLLAAVDAAGLTETLLGRGPFTLFAPTDEAFRRLPRGTVETLLEPRNRNRLRDLLTYHVVAGRVTAASAADLRSAETVLGERIRVRDIDGTLRVNDATVRIADIPARNGIIHVIDRVLMPESDRGTGSGSRSHH